MLAIRLQSVNRFSLVGQSDQRLARPMSLWLLNNDHNKPALKNMEYLGQPQAHPPFY
ncbi:hypothetical protein EMIT047CA2_310009 [Pseudomonas soli]